MVNRRKFLTLCLAAGAALAVPTQVFAQTQQTLHYHGRVTNAERQAAAAKAAQMRAQVGYGTNTPTYTVTTVPDYFGPTPNYANTELPIVDGSGNYVSGGIRKFVDSLPGLGPTGANNLGQYIPVATPDTITYPGSDYYEIELVQFSQQMHSDLKPTLLRGYHQTNMGTSTVTNTNTVAPDAQPRYMGPVIVGQKNRPIRIKFTNRLPIGAGGDLFIPTDTTYMGAGIGPNGGTEMYKQNRATVHLHGGATPWTSDGTPHQWLTPAGETTSYPKGEVYYNVPDMPDAGPGAANLYWTNQQSARLMFYHDHAYGITRLNVYAGEAAGFVLTDPVDQALISAGILPGLGIPLVIQDRTWVPNPTQLAAEDPTWTTLFDPANPVYDPTKSNLWYPHVYMPNQNPWLIDGVNACGRWDYGPWFWPPLVSTTVHTVPNPLSGLYPWEGPDNPGVPLLSGIPEGFMDTPIVNGTAYPYVTLQPQAYRFRILNACNDRMLNLQLYLAASQAPMWNLDLTGKPTTLYDGMAGEVPMVPAVPTTDPTVPTTPYPWPSDGRAGGVPDWHARGPNWIAIGTEGGFLPAPAVIPQYPVDYEYGRRSITVLNVSTKCLWLGPAERSDVIVDFSPYAGKTLILYNDAPAPVPAFDSRLDYFTGDGDQTSSGGAPNTIPGFGPNTRTIMQIRVAASVTPGAGVPLSSLSVVAGGYDYTTPAVSISGGGGSGATGTATGSVTDVHVTARGMGYTAPVVTINAPVAPATGSGATAVVAGTVDAITLGAVGAAYKNPVVNFVGGGGSGASATATFDAVTGAITGLTLVSGGVNYSSAPTVTITDNVVAPTVPGSGASATCTIAVAAINVTAGGTNYSTAPSVSITDPGGVGTGAAAFSLMSVTGIALVLAGSGFTSLPTVTIYDTVGTGLGASGAASLAPGTAFNLAALQAAWANFNGTGKSVFATALDPILVPNDQYNSAYGASFATDTYARIAAQTLTFAPLNATLNGVLPAVTVSLLPKCIQELFTLDYGRMNATLGTEIPRTTMLTQTTLPFGYIDPPTEIFPDNITHAPVTSTLYAVPPAPGVNLYNTNAQFWKITHNGVDTHAVHVHLFNAQLINRVGWDGTVKPPLPQELGWKETIIMNPLEDIIIAFQAVAPQMPFGVPVSVRRYDLTMPVGATNATGENFANINPYDGTGVTVVNNPFNFGWEYVWHCHLLGHEENDMMRAMVFQVVTALPPAVVLVGTEIGPNVKLTWTGGAYGTLGNPANVIGYQILRAPVAVGGVVGTYVQIATALASATSYTDTTVGGNGWWSYIVRSYNASGSSNSNAVQAPYNQPPLPVVLSGTPYSGRQINLTWTLGAGTVVGNAPTSFQVYRSVTSSTVGFALIATLNNPGALSYNDTSVTPSHNWWYYVMAVNGAGTAKSNVLPISTPVAPPSAPGSATTTNVTIHGCTINWTASTGGPTSYVIERALGWVSQNNPFTQIGTVPVPTLTFTDTTAASDNTYVYRVKAMGAGGSSTYTYATPTVITGPDVPPAPTNLASLSHTTTSINLTWTDNANNELGYGVFYSTNGGLTYSRVNTIYNVSAFVLTGLTSPNTYTIRVAGFNAYGQGPYSNVITVTI